MDLSGIHVYFEYAFCLGERKVWKQEKMSRKFVLKKTICLVSLAV